MKTRIRALGAFTALVLCIVAGVSAAAERPYTEGTVAIVTSVRTEPGKFDAYMAHLQGPWKQAMDAQKAAGLVVSYNVYSAMPRSPKDPDLYLVVTYKNLAALDDINARADPIMEKLFGSQQQMSEATVERGTLRTILGDEMIRQLVLK